MSLLRQNTDYALRVMVHLAHDQTDGCISARTLAQEQEISYQFACKILQQLHKANLVKSHMGPAGGFSLSGPPTKIRIVDVIEAAQGPVTLNKCLLGADACKRQPNCPVSRKLAELQEHIDAYLSSTTLSELLKGGGSRIQRSADRRQRRER